MSFLPISSMPWAIALLIGTGSFVGTAAPAIARPSADDLPTVAAAPMLMAQTDGTIVDVAAGNDNFDTLVQAVQAAGLVDTLSSEGPFTVFAPTDDAFDDLPDGVLEALLEPENLDLLTEILTYHVVPDEVTSDELETGVVDTLNGGVAVRVDPDRVVVNDSSVILPDVPASNGVIHAINRVLIPPSTSAELTRRLEASESVPRALW
ncbi:MAG: fasciclin domain-containing protein [Cyanobacteria bacterium J06639_14]